MKGRLLLDVLCQIAAVLLILLFLFDVLGCRTVGYSFFFCQLCKQCLYCCVPVPPKYSLWAFFELYHWAWRVVMWPNPPVSFFQCFAGTQNVSSLQKDEAWKVNVRIHGCDLEQGYLCGTMEALNVPLADTPVSNLFALPLQLWNLMLCIQYKD